MPRKLDAQANTYRCFRLTPAEDARLAAAAVAQSVAKGRPVTLTAVFRQLLQTLPESLAPSVKK